MNVWCIVLYYVCLLCLKHYTNLHLFTIHLIVVEIWIVVISHINWVQNVFIMWFLWFAQPVLRDLTERSTDKIRMSGVRLSYSYTKRFLPPESTLTINCRWKRIKQSRKRKEIKGGSCIMEEELIYSTNMIEFCHMSLVLADYQSPYGPLIRC